MSHVHPSLSLCFLCAHYVSLFHFSRTLQFPLTLSYCSLTYVSQSPTCIPLRLFWTLVYISCTLVSRYLRTNITCLSLVLSEVPLNAWLLAWLRPSLVSSVRLPYSQHAFQWGQSIAACRTCPFAPPLVHPDPVRSEHNKGLVFFLNPLSENFLYIFF